ncbi:PREDICTED: uncharacterized protein LOC109116558 [Tarenaya hassleriana]|uniref:uncharacterized protein LOC109116558 n=1 Tax=Tarenaya hassleriana TaxID=28532 RepID=UPI0008FD2A98|nr:PREDICTED: uncharacterized protein LOC109116558 [Tarenaya hassleriana]
MYVFKEYLGRYFHMKDLGPLKYFLGIEVARGPLGISMCQRKYVLDILNETGLLGAKPVSFPLDQNHRLAISTSEILSDPEPYRRLVGHLIYLLATRPDITYSVHILSQFMHEPRRDHWDAALRLVRYLKNNPGQGILLHSNSELRLSGWCDSDWAGCPRTRKSLSGWIVQFDHSLVSWKTKRQQTISLSFAKAEYQALAVLTCELLWFKGLLSFLGVEHTTPMTAHSDSQSALQLVANDVFHERTKHIEVDCHFLRHHLSNRNIITRHVPTGDQLADIFTKALGKKEFHRFLLKLGIHDIYART